MKQGFPTHAARRGGVGRRGGSSRHDGEAGQWLWPWRTTSVAVGMLGHGKGKQRSEGGREPESEREAERCVASLGRRREGGSKQEVARACWRASGTRPPAYWQEVEDGGDCRGLGQLELGQVGCQEVSAR